MRAGPRSESTQFGAEIVRLSKSFLPLSLNVTDPLTDGKRLEKSILEYGSTGFDRDVWTRFQKPLEELYSRRASRLIRGDETRTVLRRFNDSFSAWRAADQPRFVGDYTRLRQSLTQAQSLDDATRQLSHCDNLNTGVSSCLVRAGDELGALRRDNGRLSLFRQLQDSFYELSRKVFDRQRRFVHFIRSIV